jgi:hypothetical protein
MWMHLKNIQAKRESISALKRKYKCTEEIWGAQEELGVFLGSKGVQEEFYWSFKGVL